MPPQLLISIRGAKQTGKSSLQRRMCGKPFTEEYSATTITQARVINFAPKTKPGTVVAITLLDVVSMNARIAATSHGLPHGVIVIYNPAVKETVDYALSVIQETPRNIPIALLTNFQDVATADLHPRFRPYVQRCFTIGSSMKTNLGLAELARWLELPFALSIYASYKQMHTHAQKEIKRLNAMFDPANPRVRVGVNPDGDNDDAFWSDDDTNLLSQVKKTRRQARTRMKELPDLENIQLYAPKPAEAVPEEKEEDELMQAIIQTAAKSKRVVGLDEIDFDKEPERLAQIQQMRQPPQVVQQQPKIPTLAQQPPKERKHVHKHKHRSRGSRKRDVDLPVLPAAAPLRPPAPVFRPTSQMRQDIPLSRAIHGVVGNSPTTQVEAPAPAQHNGYDTI